MSWQSVRSILIASSLLIVAACVNPEPRQEWNILPEDKRVTASDLTPMIVGKTITYSDGSSSTIREDGSYVFSAPDGTTYPWNWKMSDDGIVCLESGEYSRCDLFVLSDGVLTLINRSGSRYPIVKTEPI